MTPTVPLRTALSIPASQTARLVVAFIEDVLALYVRQAAFGPLVGFARNILILYDSQMVSGASQRMREVSYG